MFRSILLLLVLVAAMANAFVVTPSSSIHSSATQLAGWGDAFKNDDSLGARENAGLKGGPKYNENVVINGKPIKAVVGQKLKQVANSARVKISYNCQQGDCGTCVVKMNGRQVKACVTSIPAGKCNIETP